MKKKFYYAAIFAAGLMTISTSCNNEDEIINDGEGTEVAAEEQVIVLDVQNTDILSTKSRPLYSTENQGAEKVTDVKILIFKEAENNTMQFVNALPITEWDVNSTDYSYGRQYTLKLTDENKLTEAGTYTILAVGQDEVSTSPSPYTINAPGVSGQKISASWNVTTSSIWNNSSEVGGGFMTTTALDYANVADGHLAGEIFSGISDPITINLTDEETTAGFTAKVLLKRQVAGVIGYFNRIPAFVLTQNDGDEVTDYTAVKKIRLVASNRNTQLDLTYNLAVQKDDDTHTSINDVDLENVVNGFSTTDDTKDAWYKAAGSSASSNDAYIVYEIDLADWFTVNSAAADDASYWYAGGTYDGTIPTLGDDFGTATGPRWRNKYSSVNYDPYVVTNSVLAGEFVIPFKKVDKTNTFELQLIGTESSSSTEKVLKSWNVALSDVVPGSDDTKYIHSIYRNQLYQIGQRGAGDNPDNPGEGGDKPQPLDKDQDLTIRINDSWEIIHDLEID